MATHSSTPGISRIDQPEKHTHGFFVRLRRRGELHTAFFTDLKYGGKKKALAAARQHYQWLLARHGGFTRQERARMGTHLIGASGILGVRKFYRRGKDGRYEYWQASWSPTPLVVAKMQFSVRKYGPKMAKALAMEAREQGLRQMKD